MSVYLIVMVFSTAALIEEKNMVNTTKKLEKIPTGWRLTVSQSVETNYKCSALTTRPDLHICDLLGQRFPVLHLM